MQCATCLSGTLGAADTRVYFRARPRMRDEITGADKRFKAAHGEIKSSRVIGVVRSLAREPLKPDVIASRREQQLVGADLGDAEHARADGCRVVFLRVG